MSKQFAIAIDGPVASGKGTLAASLARELQALYIYTGAMYRALTVASLRRKIDLGNEQAVSAVLKTVSIQLRQPAAGEKRTFAVFLDGEDITDSIYEKEVDDGVPIVAALSSIRKEMVKLQQKLAQGKSVVMEGRDITTDVLPDADLKIYLTASLEERARRRYEQFKKKGSQRSLSQIIEEIKERDRQDIERGASPLKIIENATVLDTTSLTVEETVKKVKAMMREKGLI